MILKMKAIDPAVYMRFIDENSLTFGEPPQQPTARLVEHLCHLIMRTLAAVVASGGDERKSVKDMMALTHDNVRLFQLICVRKKNKM